MRDPLSGPSGRADVTATHGPVVVAGVGAPDRGDDAVGLLVARLVGETVPDATVVEVGDPSRLLNAWEGAAGTVVVDAVRTGAAPGALHVWEAHDRTVRLGPA